MVLNGRNPRKWQEVLIQIFFFSLFSQSVGPEVHVFLGLKYMYVKMALHVHVVHVSDWSIICEMAGNLILKYI